MAHLDLGDFPARPDVGTMIARRRQRNITMLAAMSCASFAIVGVAALFLAATF